MRAGFNPGELFLWAMILVPPLLLASTAKDSFRLPKLMLSEWLGLASLLLLSWRLRAAKWVAPRRLAGEAGPRVVVPILAVATLGLAFTAHPAQVRDSLVDLWIGAACLVGWSAALPAGRLRRALDLLLVPSLLLALLALLQFHDLYRPFAFVGGKEGERLGVTSLAGNPGDLGAFLVLPCLLAQIGAWRTRGAKRLAWGAALALLVYGLGVTETLAAFAALAAGSLTLWASLLPRKRAFAATAAGFLLIVVVTAGVAPLRERVIAKLGDLAAGRFNSVLTGRLDGWRAAVWMIGRHPVAGVGQGAFGAEFAPAKLALVADGEEFYQFQPHPVFANAHNEYLEAAAEWGLPGALALCWAIWEVALAARRIGSASTAGDVRPEEVAADRALAWAGLTALALLSLASFPFRIALTGFPALLFLSWVLARGRPAQVALATETAG